MATETTKFKKIMNMLAFCGLVLVATAIVLQAILGWFSIEAKIVNIFRIIGECAAYLVTAFYAFFFVKGRTKPVWAIVYAVCVTVIIVLLFLR